MFFDKEYKELVAWIDVIKHQSDVVELLVKKSYAAELVREIKRTKQCSLEQYEKLEFYISYLNDFYRKYVGIKDNLYMHRKNIKELLKEFKAPNAADRLSFQMARIMETALKECSPEEYAEIIAKSKHLIKLSEWSSEKER